MPKGLRGFLIFRPDLDRIVFRVYEQEIYQDYEIKHDSLQVEIVSDYAELYKQDNQDKNTHGYIGYIKKAE